MLLISTYRQFLIFDIYLVSGKRDKEWRTAFDFYYWLKAFEAFPHRIGFSPQLQGRKRLQSDT